MILEGRVCTCRECFEEYINGPARVDDGFCSDVCMNAYEREIVGLNDREEDLL